MLSDEIRVKKAASQLGLQYYTLAEWRKNRKAKTRLPNPATNSEQYARIRELERENNELRQANDILKDTPSFSQKTERSKDK